jgi:hypothetical protein
VFRNLLRKKRALGVLSAIAVLAVAGIAVAYWTTSGSGSGSGSVNSSNGTLVLNGTIAPGLTPGGEESVSYTADNAGSSNLQVGTVKAVVSIDATHATAGCKASDFSVADTVENQTIAHNSSGTALTNSGTIKMADSLTVDQSACKGAEITLALTS